ncbi:MAG: PAS domain-containing protein [Acidobacteriota bacterium]|nr:PAS domain-containing protein [Acidobacteriota bacterium]
MSVKLAPHFMLDPDGNIVTWNKGAQRIKDYQPKEIIGRHFSTPKKIWRLTNRNTSWRSRPSATASKTKGGAFEKTERGSGRTS